MPPALRQTRSGGFRPRRPLRRLIAGALLGLLFGQTAAANLAERPYNFRIDASDLSQALLQVSRQSGLAIVFSDQLTRRLPASPVNGDVALAAALDQLLEPVGLAWTLVDGRIIAITRGECHEKETSPGCREVDALLSRHPLYVPGIEETYVYGSRVTGSRIRRAHYEGSAPVDIITAPDIELSGAQTLGDLLKFVPAVSGNAVSTAISNGGDGTATVTLRGLPASNTLVLINGRRVANNGLAGESVDLNSIPPAAVERIEILKDGASAIYGSDAIAGVVNVIMKRDFHGLLTEAYYGEAAAGDLETSTYTVQYGTGLPHGSLFLSATSYSQDAIFSRDRSVSASADGRLRGGADQRSSATPNARITLPSGQQLIHDNGRYREATPEDLFNYQDYTSAVVPMDRRSLYGNASYDFSEQVTGLVEASYLDTRAGAVLAPTPVFTGFEQDPLIVAADNIYNSFGEELLDVRRRLVELPQRRQIDSSEVMRFSAVMEGLYEDWNWDVGYSWSRSEAQQETRNLVNADNLRRAIGPAAQCQGGEIDGCVPVNVLAGPGSIDAEQVDYIVATGKVRGHSTLSNITLNVSNEGLDLPIGSTDMAFGLEFRQESTSKKPSALLASVGTIGATNFEATAGSRKITELYAETIVNAWNSADGDASLNLEGAVRFSDYSDFGGDINPRLGLRLQLSPSVLVRASYADGFRAPSLNELYQGATEDQAFITDPCTQPNNIGRLPGCTLPADPTRNQFLTVTGGNPELAPETSSSYGAGLVITPLPTPGLTLSADAFSIDQRKVVSSSAQYIVDQNARFGRFDERVQRDALGNLQLVDAVNLNVGRRKVEGADLSLMYKLPSRHWGQLSIASNATWIARYEAQLDSAAPAVDFAGTFIDPASEGLGGIPEWKGQISVQWARQRWRGNYELHYISNLRERIPGTQSERSIAAWAVHDIQLSYMFDVLDGLRFTVGLDNALDESAPFAASSFLDNIDGRSHELKGRFWYTKLSQRF